MSSSGKNRIEKFAYVIWYDRLLPYFMDSTKFEEDHHFSSGIYLIGAMDDAIEYQSQKLIIQ